MEFTINLNNPILHVCRSLNITQKELSLMMGVSEGTVNRWNSNSSDIPKSTLYFLNLILVHSMAMSELDKYKLIFHMIKDAIK